MSSRTRSMFLLVLSVVLCGMCSIATARAQHVDLYIGTHTFGEPTYHFDGSTGAFIDTFGTVPGERGYGVAVGSSGDVWADYYDNGLIRRWNPSTGNLVDTFGPVDPSDGRSEGLLLGPDGLLYGVSPSHLYRYDPRTDTGSFVFNGNGNGGSNNYQMIAFGPDGNVYVSAATTVASTAGIQRFNPVTGAYLGTFIPSRPGELGSKPEGLTFGFDGNLYVADIDTDSVLRYNGTTGAFLNVFIPAGSGGLISPNGIAFGPDGNLYVTDIAGNDVLRFNGVTGAFLDDFIAPGSHGLTVPESLVFVTSPSIGVPEPGVLPTLGAGLVFVTILRRRRRRV